jgi:hypothetical protein
VLGAAKFLSTNAYFCSVALLAFADLDVVANSQRLGVSGPDVVGELVEYGGKGSFFRVFALSVLGYGARWARRMARKHHIFCLQ